MQGVIFEMDVSNIKCEYLNGAYSELANLLDIEAVLKIHSAYRGQQITFPVQLFSKEFLKKQIVDEYNGYNIKQLATKYGYSEKWVRQILKEHIDKQKSD
jgi:Mor family transcriptional regulator